MLTAFKFLAHLLTPMAPSPQPTQTFTIPSTLQPDHTKPFQPHSIIPTPHPAPTLTRTLSPPTHTPHSMPSTATTLKPSHRTFAQSSPPSRHLHRATTPSPYPPTYTTHRLIPPNPHSKPNISHSTPHTLNLTLCKAATGHPPLPTLQRPHHHFPPNLSPQISDYTKDDTFVFYLNDPSELKVKKQQLLSSLLDKMSAAKPTRRLCSLLAENNRLKDLPEVATNFQQLVDHSKGTKEATVVTAKVRGSGVLWHLMHCSVVWLLQRYWVVGFDGFW